MKIMVFVNLPRNIAWKDSSSICLREPLIREEFFI